MRPKLLRGAGWLMGARLGFNLLGLVSTLVLARLLTPADFGLVAIAVSVNAVLSSLFTMSATAALVRLDEVTDDHLGTAFTLTFARSLLIAAGLAIAAWPMALVYDDPRLAPLILVIAGGMLLPGLANPALVALQRKLQFWQEFVLQISEKLAAVVAAILIAWLTGSYWALVLGTVAGRAASLVASYAILPYLPRPTLKEWRTIWGFTGWLSAGTVLSTLNFRLDQFFIGGILGQSALGQYVVGDDLAALPVREATRPLTSLLYPAFSTMKDRADQLRRVYLQSMSVVFAVAMPLGIGFALVAEPVILLLMGEKWSGAIIVIETLGVFFAARAFTMPSEPIAMTVGATKILFYRTLINFVVRAPLALGALFLAGLPGLLAARLFSGFMMIALSATMVRYLIGLKLADQFAAVWRTLIGIAAMAGAVLAWRSRFGWSVETPEAMWFELFGVAAGGAVIYVAVHLALWVACGRPRGAEQEILRLVSQLLGKVSGRRAV
ncbi:hypothetical protein B5C34_03810 [Pacificimonas flava]|uniref:Polysaccharide biosynthesis protein C-terminal domain-containing protein n=2 Tax=Pacificimonas TaxID=1960290 RepID=A0A219B2U0_9SPHN|nr:MULTISPECIES: lipopolysaccharide biosynthesis protein [Pacificimonas]OWV32660.1 hypothetical protein B5C34_03810 [Pacificimonas flava]